MKMKAWPRSSLILALAAHCDASDVSAYLHRRSGGSYNFTSYDISKPVYSGQELADQWVDEVLGRLEGGFAVESGAYDGEGYSNTLFLEIKRRWRCLLIEPNPFLIDAILRKDRECILLKAGLSVAGYAKHETAWWIPLALRGLASAASGRGHQALEGVDGRPTGQWAASPSPDVPAA
eukprot:gb/GFBE01028496.1/.p1 GENE.gb/GFBE01028496.1/~~gb/GFBE01028496.1/.p1  ORF type:complete len:178 (+),score=18.08 gb/GFBE01028496.1/:1-534(+)